MTAFIWDFDGTLVESYAAIMEVLDLIFAEQGWEFDADHISQFILETSIGHLLDVKCQEAGLDARPIKARFMAEQEKRDDQIVLMPHAQEVLFQTASQGVRHFIYTHKGATTDAVLEGLGIAEYFTEVLNSASGFARKPEPDALNYLIDKYGLDRSKTYYIGDRPLDMEVAERAGVHSINLKLPDSATNTHIDSLADILALPIFN